MNNTLVRWLVYLNMGIVASCISTWGHTHPWAFVVFGVGFVVVGDFLLFVIGKFHRVRNEEDGESSEAD